jgi:hypothetical protein
MGVTHTVLSWGTLLPAKCSILRTEVDVVAIGFHVDPSGKALLKGDIAKHDELARQMHNFILIMRVVGVNAGILRSLDDSEPFRIEDA